jgi:aspartate-semialdehyde dehydrogenase
VAGPGEPKVAIVGATGAVGTQLVELLETRAFPRGGLKLFASASGAAGTVETDDDDFQVEELQDPGDLRGFDLAFLAIPESKAAEIIRAKPGPMLIDLSACGRAPSGESMVAPGITPRERMRAQSGGTVFETPHPAAHALAVILNAIGTKLGFAGATLLAGASAGGRDLVAATAERSADLLSGRFNPEPGEIQRGFNIFVTEHDCRLSEIIRAQVGALMKGGPALMLQVMNAPILHGSVLALELPPSPEAGDWPARLKSAAGLLLVEDRNPLGVIDALGHEAIVVRLDRGPGGAALFCAFDNTRLAALAAVWIAESVLLTSQ